MINFNEEIKKYKPVLEIENIEKSSTEDEIADILDLLQYIAKNSGHMSDKEKSS